MFKRCDCREQYIPWDHDGYCPDCWKCGGTGRMWSWKWVRLIQLRVRLAKLRNGTYKDKCDQRHHG